MKKWILPLLAAVLTVSGCGVFTETPAERQARAAREARLVKSQVESGNFTIRIDRMYPLRGSSKAVTNFSVSVKDGVLQSNLPFVGQAWRVPYGGGHALNFTAEIMDYRAVPFRKDGYEIRISVRTDEDSHVYTFQVFDNGRASLDVQSGNRDRISYSGEMEFPAE